MLSILISSPQTDTYRIISCADCNIKTYFATDYDDWAKILSELELNIIEIMDSPENRKEVKDFFFGIMTYQDRPDEVKSLMIFDATIYVMNEAGKTVFTKRLTLND